MHAYQPQRRPGTNSRNGSFSQAEILAVWNKAHFVPGQDPGRIRKDACGAMIALHLYGDTSPGGFGWEIDHMMPVARGGSDHISNLQPLQWENNRAKSDSLPGQWVCAVSYR